jgi:hypothetical protein
MIPLLKRSCEKPLRIAALTHIAISPTVPISIRRGGNFSRPSAPRLMPESRAQTPGRHTTPAVPPAMS